MALLDPFLTRPCVAYFSMEMALRPEIHTYSGGLGVLAGDTARSCADLDLPVVFVTLASRQGYLRQEIDAEGRQTDHPDPWDPAEWATPLGAMIAVTIEARPVWIRPWLYVLTSPLGHAVPGPTSCVNAGHPCGDAPGTSAKCAGCSWVTTSGRS